MYKKFGVQTFKDEQESLVMKKKMGGVAQQIVNWLDCVCALKLKMSCLEITLLYLGHMNVEQTNGHPTTT